MKVEQAPCITYALHEANTAPLIFLPGNLFIVTHVMNSHGEKKYGMRSSLLKNIISCFVDRLYHV